MKRFYIQLNTAALLITALFFMGCSGYLDTLPSDSLVSDEAITNQEDAETALNGAYYTLITDTYYGNNFISRAEVGGEDIQTLTAGKRTENFYRHGYRQNTVPSGLWSIPYKTINRVNVLLEALNSDIIPESNERDRVYGEALALRALCHFNLLITYGTPYLKDNGSSLGVPLVEEVLPATALPSRSTVAEGYTMVLKDLAEAERLLDKAEDIKGHINKWAVKGLIARVNLYKGDYDTAYKYATDVIKNSPYTLIPNQEYIASWEREYSSESIFELTITSLSSGNRELFGYVAHPDGYGAVIATKNFVDLLMEDPNDIRLGLLQEDAEEELRFVNKLPGRGGVASVNNVKILRLSDLYLIAAEAALSKSTTEQNAADTYLNAIIKRANPNATPVTATKENVFKERRKELVMEGHRLYDILRAGLSVTRTGGYHFLNQANDLITVNWDDYRTILPIPQAEIDANPNIRGEQNPKY